MITFIVSGLWHGANWTFLAWGAVHGAAQIVENAFVPKNYEPHGIMRGVKVVITFVFVMFAWVFFRANSIGEAVYIYSHMFRDILTPSLWLPYFRSIAGDERTYASLMLILAIVPVTALYDFISQRINVISFVSSRNLLFRWLVYDVLIGFTFFVYSTFAVRDAAFVYFQF